MNNFLTSEQLQVHWESTDFVLKTQRQIVKDFYTSGLFFDPSFESEEHAISEIVNQIQSHVESIMKYGESQFLQLLYQIDIPQNEFLEMITQPNFIENISKLILQREAFKVYLRSKL